MPAYYPLGDQEFLAFVNALVAKLPDVMTALTLPATFDDAIIAALADYDTKLTTHVASQTQAVADRTAKDASKDALIAALIFVVNQLRPNPLFTGDLVTSLGLAEYDTTPTPILTGEEVPTLVIDTSAPQHHTVKFLMVTAGGGLGKAKPSWARACRIVHKIVASGAPAPAIETMDFLATDTNSPYEWDIPGTEVGKDIWYRGAFETPKGEIGNWSDPAKGTVTG